jgi:hypothetical protein
VFRRASRRLWAGGPTVFTRLSSNHVETQIWVESWKCCMCAFSVEQEKKQIKRQNWNETRIIVIILRSSGLFIFSTSDTLQNFLESDCNSTDISLQWGNAGFQPHSRQRITWVFLRCYSIDPGKYRDFNLDYSYAASFPILSKLIIHGTIQFYIPWDSESVVK